MKNKLAAVVAVLTMVGLMSVGPTSYAMSEEDNPESGKGDKRGEDQESKQGPMQELMEALDLTPSQRAEFLAQQDPAQQERNKAIVEQMKSKIQALDVAVNESGTTLMDASDLIEAIGALYTKMLSQKMEHLFAMKKILTPEQFAKMQEIGKQPMNQKPKGVGVKNQGPHQGPHQGSDQGSDQGSNQG